MCMKGNAFFDFKEPIFLINGEESTFLEGTSINEFGIILDQNSFIPPKKGTIEFSFSGTERIVRVNYDLKLWQDSLFAQFSDLNKNDMNFIKSFFKQSQETKISLSI